MENKKVNIMIATGIIFLIAIIFSIIFYLESNNKKLIYSENATIADLVCAEDTEKCSDGTVVGRTGSNCEFFCPTPIETINEPMIEYKNPCPKVKQEKATSKQVKRIDVDSLIAEFSFQVPKNWLTETRRPTNEGTTADEIRNFLTADCNIPQKSYFSDYFNMPQSELQKMNDDEIRTYYNDFNNEHTSFPNASVSAGDYIWYRDMSWKQIDFFILKNFSDLKTYFNTVWADMDSGVWADENIDGFNARVIKFNTSKDDNGNEIIDKWGTGGKIYFIKINDRDMLIVDKQAKGDTQFELNFKNLIKSLKINVKK